MRAFSQWRCTVRSDTPRIARDLGEGEAAEELQVDELGERGLDRRELVERVADPRELPSSAADRRRRPSSEVISKPPPRFWACRLRA